MGMDELVEELRRCHADLFLLSNIPAEVETGFRQRFPTLEHFQRAILSGREGVAKPDPRVYELLLSRYQLEPQETAFIDDHLPNVEGARACGLQGWHFQGAASLADFLPRHWRTSLKACFRDAHC